MKILKESERVYLNHIESGKAHAFAAQRIPGSKSAWVLLDSLHKMSKVVVNEADMMKVHDNAGRASILFTRDLSRPIQILQ